MSLLSYNSHEFLVPLVLSVPLNLGTDDGRAGESHRALAGIQLDEELG